MILAKYWTVILIDILYINYPCFFISRFLQWTIWCVTKILWPNATLNFSDVRSIWILCWLNTSPGMCGTLKRLMWYFEEGIILLWRGWCGTLKRVLWYFEEVMWYFKEGDVVLWRGWCGTSKRVMWYLEEGGVVLWIGWCGTLKRVLWYFVEGDMVLWRGCYGTSKRVMWYFEEVDVVLWRGWCGTSKRVLWYFEEGVMVLWRGCYGTSKRWCGTLNLIMKMFYMFSVFRKNIDAIISKFEASDLCSMVELQVQLEHARTTHRFLAALFTIDSFEVWTY